MVWMGLVRPIEGYLLFAPCGPVWSKLSASEITLPFFTSRAAATMSSAWVKLSVPISSFGPHLPQFLYFSAASRMSWRVSLRLMLWGPKKVKEVAYQAAAVAVVAAIGWFLLSNTAANLEARKIASGLGFLGRAAGFEIGESLFFSYNAGDTYTRAFTVGIANTLLVGLIGIVLATILGTAIGISRLSHNSLVKGLAAAY